MLFEGNVFDRNYSSYQILFIYFPQLELVDINGVFTGKSFSLKYCDVENVLDFLVLRQNYDVAIQRLQNNWKPGNRFRSIIIDNEDPNKEDMWFEGSFLGRKAYEDRPQSSIDCCCIK